MRTPTVLIALLLASAARAQFTDSVGFNYNNANSALIGTMIQNNIHANVMRSAIMSGGTATRILTRGGGRSSGSPTAFRPRPYPVEHWLQNWSQGDPAKRRSSYAEWVRQKAIWDGEVRARGTKRDDLAQMMATAFVLAYEAATGERASMSGYRRMVAEFHKTFDKDAGLVGANNDRKNEIAEGALLDTTDAVMRRRNGSADGIARAKAGGEKFLDRWWDDKHAAAIAFVRKAGPDPHTTDYAAALRATAFHRVAPSLLPEMLRRNLPEKENRRMAGEMSEKLLASVRQGLRQNAADAVGVDNVGRGVAFALLQLHQVALSTPGRPVGENVASPTRAQLVALRRRLILNLGANAELRRMSDRDKQLMTESLYVLPALTDLLYRVGAEKGNLEAQRAAREAARRAFTGFFGTSPEGFRFE